MLEMSKCTPSGKSQNLKAGIYKHLFLRGEVARWLTAGTLGVTCLDLQFLAWLLTSPGAQVMLCNCSER